MSLAADAMQPNLIRAIVTMRGRAEPCSLADSFIEKGGPPFDLDFDNAVNGIDIDFRDRNYIAKYIAGDIYRYSYSSFISLLEIQPAIENRESIGWAMIKLYYSAFYAAHGTLRLLGKSCSQLDGGHIARISALSEALGRQPNFQLQSGVYDFSLNSGQTGYRLKKEASATGGTHEVFWRMYDKFLSNLANNAMSGNLTPYDATQFYDKVSTYRNVLSSQGLCSSWLSFIRNDIQYRHRQGVWLKDQLSKTQRERVSRLAIQWCRDPMEIDIIDTKKRTVADFVSACAFTISLFRCILERVAERSDAGAHSFAKACLTIGKCS